MLGPLTLLVLATAAFSAAVVLLRSPSTPPDRIGRGVDREQVQGFVLVGATALAVLGLAVPVVGWVADRPGVAEALAVIGLMAYLVYLAVAVLVIRRTAHLRPEPPPTCAEPVEGPQRRSK